MNGMNGNEWNTLFLFQRWKKYNKIKQIFETFLKFNKKILGSNLKKVCRRFIKATSYWVGNTTTSKS